MDFFKYTEVRAMAKTNAERQRAWRERQKMNSIRHEEYKQQERERWNERRQAGRCPKQVIDMITKELNTQRQRWRDSQRMSRQRKRIAAPILAETPANSPDGAVDANNNQPP